MKEITGRGLRAVRGASEPGPPEKLPRPELQVGQIWVARPDEGDDVLVLVTEVHDDHVQVVLCGRDGHHLAAETDIVLRPGETGCPHRVLVHGDVAGRVMKTRLSGSPGRVHRSIVRRIVLRGYGFDFHSSDLGRAAPIAGASDPRWEWKQEKARELRAVQARAADLGWGIYKLGESSGGDGDD